MQDELEMSGDSSMTSSAEDNSSVRMNKSELENLVRSRHKAGYEKGRSESMADVETRLRSELESRIKAETDPDKLNRLIDDRAKQLHQEALRRQDEHQANKIVENFWGIMNKGESPNPEREEHVQGMQFGQMPQLVKLATEFPDTARHIFHEFDAHPEKLAQVLMLANVDENKARDYMSKLSDSIKKNITAQAPDLKAPLSQIRPTHTGTDSGKPSIRDLRKLYASK